MVRGCQRGPGGSPGEAPLSWDRQRRLWWLLWGQCPGVGTVRLSALEVRFGGLEAAWGAPAAELAAQPGWGRSLLAQVESFRRGWGPQPLPRLAQLLHGGRGVLVPGDPRWPAAMAALPRPPLALWWRGQGSFWPLLARRGGVAVVGTRRPSSHGLVMAHRLGAALAAAGWPVVSGLAEGIDGEAHRGALAARGAPVAVLGTPLERVYPRHHGSLQAEVGRTGLLLSEQPPGAAVLRGHFASRNRLLVALARAVVVVECPPRSGALLSAELAWSQELPLWVIPADAARQSAAGSNRLLAQGATPLLDPADLIAQLGPGPLAGRCGVEAGSARPRGGVRSAAQRALLEAVGGGASLEQLCRHLGSSPAQLAPRLLQMELAGQLRAEPGLLWRPAAPPSP
ncbi:MAG: DNA-processing protein DprA [Synechococcaceae cyanobacterium]|nr:DNA-processing protein DprA [Synechococcaceae cyanobacterium]